MGGINRLHNSATVVIINCSNARCSPKSFTSSKLGPAIPALFMSTSTESPRRSMSSQSCLGDSCKLKSHSIIVLGVDSDSASERSLSPLRATRIKCSHRPSSCLANSAPSPEEAPVINAVPFNDFPLFSCLSCLVCHATTLPLVNAQTLR